MNKSNSLLYIALTITAICFLATGGIFVKLSYLPPVATGFYRVLFSLPILLPFIKKDDLKKVSKGNIIITLFAGIFLALDLITWNISFTLTTVANGNLLANLVPFTIIPFTYFVYKKRFSKSFYISLIISLFGLILLMNGKINPTIDNFKGDILAFITSIFYAGFLLSVDKVRNSLSAHLIMFISAFSSLIVLLIAMLILEGFYYPKNTNEFLPLLSLALVSQILGQGLLSFTVKKIDVSLSSILILSQPAIAGIYAMIIFHEILSFKEVISIVIILLGIFIAKKSL